MDPRFKSVPKEVAEIVDTGIFWINYTHLTTDFSRQGIEKTGKILSAGTAMGDGIIPFTGEFLLVSHLGKRYVVSVSDYPPQSHSWRDYISTFQAWTPEGSDAWIAKMKEYRGNVLERKINLGDFLNPNLKQNVAHLIDECIESEEHRKKTYGAMNDEERGRLKNQRPEIYAFDSKLSKLVRKNLPRYGVKSDHPIAPSEIKLERYLTGMFTEGDVAETARWVSNLVGRSIPVASIDALATWETIFPQLPIAQKFERPGFFYRALMDDLSVRSAAISETKAYCEKTISPVK